MAFMVFEWIKTDRSCERHDAVETGIIGPGGARGRAVSRIAFLMRAPRHGRIDLSRESGVSAQTDGRYRGTLA